MTKVDGRPAFRIHPEPGYKLTDRERIEILRKGLVESQRNHHGQMIALKNSFDPKSRWGTGHHGSSWRKCPAMSCQTAARTEKVGLDVRMVR